MLLPASTSPARPPSAERAAPVGRWGGRGLVVSALLLVTAPAARAEAAGTAAPAAPAPVPATSAEVLRAASESGAKAVLVNVWATWCIPCREEFPDLLKARKELKPRGFELVLVTTDFDSALPQAVKFLGQQGVDFKTYQKKERDPDFIDGLSAGWSGTLPTSLLFDSKGQLQHSWEGRVTYADLKARVEELLSSSAPDKPNQPSNEDEK